MILRGASKKNSWYLFASQKFLEIAAADQLLLRLLIDPLNKVNKLNTHVKEVLRLKYDHKSIHIIHFEMPFALIM